MTAKDDDDDGLEPMMRSMRSVWRDMREEEPPARGFAELMAAARVQAETMQSEKAESWWRRGFAMLLRPPMLAAATVVVLIGGAVVLSQRGADKQVASTSTESRPAHGEESLRAKQGDLDRDAKLVAPAAAPSMNPVAPGNAPSMNSLEPGHAPSLDPVAPDGHAPPPAVRRPRPAPAIVRETTKQDLGTGTAKDANAEPSKPAPDKGKGLHIAGESEGAVDPAPKKEVIKSTEPSAPTTGRAPASEDGVSATDNVTAVRPTARPTQPPIDQLINQTETAARRNDCAAVKATAERIRKLDGAVYKARVVTQPAIARCLK